MEKLWSDAAWSDYCWWQTQDKKTLKRINNLIKEIERNPNDKTIGKGELLTGGKAGMRSARIDETNRLVYTIENNYMRIISCKGHYKQR